MKEGKEKKEECPLCQVSNETLDRLKEKDKNEKSSEKATEKKRGFLGKLFRK